MSFEKFHVFIPTSVIFLFILIYSFISSIFSLWYCLLCLPVSSVVVWFIFSSRPVAASPPLARVPAERYVAPLSYYEAQWPCIVSWYRCATEPAEVEIYTYIEGIDRVRLSVCRSPTMTCSLARLLITSPYTLWESSFDQFIIYRWNAETTPQSVRLAHVETLLVNGKIILLEWSSKLSLPLY